MAKVTETAVIDADNATNARWSNRFFQFRLCFWYLERRCNFSIFEASNRKCPIAFINLEFVWMEMSSGLWRTDKILKIAKRREHFPKIQTFGLSHEFGSVGLPKFTQSIGIDNQKTFEEDCRGSFPPFVTNDIYIYSWECKQTYKKAKACACLFNDGYGTMEIAIFLSIYIYIVQIFCIDPLSHRCRTPSIFGNWLIIVNIVEKLCSCA